MNEEKLRRYLQKCELQYRADHMDEACELEWLAPHCKTVQELAGFLKSLGFQISKIVDETSEYGDVFKWVETKTGIIVYAETNGLFAKAYNPKI